MGDIRVLYSLSSFAQKSKRTYPRGRAESVFQIKQSMCEIDKIGIHEIGIYERFIHKKEAERNPATEQHFSEKFDQQYSELLEKDRFIEELKNEVEKLKVELAQAQLLIMEKEETACVPSETCATVRLPGNTGNSVHSQIRGNGYSLDRVEGVSVSQGEEIMCDTPFANKPNMALRFPSKDERNKAIDLCWVDPDLIHVPRDIADGLTMVIPKEFVALFKSKGFIFTASPVLSQDALTLEEQRLLRKKYSM